MRGSPGGAGAIVAERLLDGNPGDFDPRQIGCPDPDRLGQAEHIVAAQERFRAALGPRVISHDRHAHGVGADRVPARQDDAGFDHRNPWVPRALTAADRFHAIDDGQVYRPHAGQVRYDPRDAVAGLPRRLSVEFLRHTLGRRHGAVVANRSAFPPGVLIAIGAAIAAVQRAGGVAEVVFERHGDAGQPVVLQFREGNVDVAIGEGVVQVDRREDIPAPRYLHSLVLPGLSHVLGVLPLHLAANVVDGVDVQAVARPQLQVLFRGKEGLDQANACRTRPCDLARERQHRRGLVAVRQFRAVGVARNVAGQVQLDSHRLALYQRTDAADLI